MNAIKYHIRRILPAIIVGILLFAFPSCNFLEQKLDLGKYSLKSAIEWAKADSARVADSIKRIRLAKKDIKKPLPDSVKKGIKNKEAFEKTLTDSLVSIVEEGFPAGGTSPRFYIIAGSFSTHANADEVARKFSGKGYKSTIIKTTKNGASLELVSVKTFSDYDKASVFLKEFKVKYDPGAWIYSGK